MKDPKAIAAKQVRNLSGAVTEIEIGVRAVTESPTAKAADNLDKAKAAYIKSIDSGKMARNLRAVSVEDWKKALLDKVDRIATGIAAAEPTLVRFHEQRNAHQARIDGELKGMPTRSLPEMIRRMTHQVTKMAEFSFDKSK